MEKCLEIIRIFKALHRDDRGEHAMEFLLILVFGIFPIMMLIPFLARMLQEYVAFGQIFISSPFF